MKFLKLFEQKSYEEHVSEICQRYNIRNWSINSEGLVDVDGDVFLYRYNLIELPLSFGHVSGNFYCADNYLTSLEGAPISVDGYFDCNSNELTSLEGGTKSVGGDFYCWSNKLTSLRFAPEEVEGGVSVLPNSIADIPEKYLNKECLQFIVKEQYDWNLYRKDGSMRLDRLEEMIEWGIETKKIKPL
jgi:hypothetical protein